MDTTRRLSAKTLVGESVHNAQGEKLGELVDIVFEMPSGQAIYAALSVGGVLGVGEKLFAVPWSALRFDIAHDHRVLLEASPERLKTATGFDKDNWPDEADTGFVERTHTNYT